jgi:hypothetical protein
VLAAAYTVRLDDTAEQVGVSIGVSRSAASAIAALRDADQAMFATKERRRTVAGDPTTVA